MIEHITLHSGGSTLGTLSIPEAGRWSYRSSSDSTINKQVQSLVNAVNRLSDAPLESRRYYLDKFLIDYSNTISIGAVVAAVAAPIEYSLYISEDENPTVLGLTYGDNDGGDFKIRKDGQWVELSEVEQEFVFNTSFVSSNENIIEQYDTLGSGVPLTEYEV